MTTPLPATEPEKILVQAGSGVVKGPTGKPWVMLKIVIGLTEIAMQMPPATADELVQRRPPKADRGSGEGPPGQHGADRARRRAPADPPDERRSPVTAQPTPPDAR